MVICDMLNSAVTLRKKVSEKVLSRYNKKGNGRKECTICIRR